MYRCHYLDEYRQFIEKDGALERRFQKVTVDPTSPEETVQILNNIKDKYESITMFCIHLRPFKPV
jgi:ATP-dependent Clp protease ATP-binding subunit ClpA